MINDRVLTMSQNTLRLSDLKSSSESRVTLEQTSDTGIFPSLKQDLNVVQKWNRLISKQQDYLKNMCWISLSPWYLICIEINENADSREIKMCKFSLKDQLRYVSS